MEHPKRPMAMNPQKFALWLLIVSIVMMFAAMTSAYIVRRAEGNWLEVEIPFIMYVSTGVILLSSITMHWAYLSARRDNLQTLKVALLVTTLLGLAFVAAQWHSRTVLRQEGVFFGGELSNPGGSFIYVLAGLHVFHLITGVIFLFVVLVSAFGYKVHSKNMNLIEMSATYWHFLDALWIYLFVFLLLNH